MLVYFNLTQPMRVATANLHIFMCVCSMCIFQSNATRAGCNSKLVQTKQQVIMYFVQCLSVFLTIQYGRIQLTAMESYPFFIIFGAKRPAKLCSLIIRTGSKQKYRHLIMRWRYVDFECLFAFIFGMYSVCLLCSRLQVFFSNSEQQIARKLYMDTSTIAR